jgi:hypothetical protein
VHITGAPCSDAEDPTPASFVHHTSGLFLLPNACVLRCIFLFQGVDENAEALLFQCEGLVVANSTGAENGGLLPGEQDPLTSQAFSLSSRPNARSRIYLNFLGGDVTGTAWNYGRNATLTIPPFSTTWTAADLAVVVATWRSVAGEYAYKPMRHC